MRFFRAAVMMCLPAQLKGGILIEKETLVLTSAREAITAAKLRAHNVARRDPVFMGRLLGWSYDTVRRLADGQRKRDQ
jgi:hypothetical protein